MAYSKADKFSEDEIELAKLAKALSHPARIAILKFLATKNVCICGDIVDELPLSQSTTSQHLKELKTAGLIKGDIDGPRVCYCLNPVVIAKARQNFDLLFESSNCCDC